MAEQFLTVEQTAARLQVRPITVRRHLRSGLLRGIKRGHLWRIPESALLENPTVNQRASTQSAYARAFELMAQLENDMRGAPKRIDGVNDIATEIRKMREEQTP